MSKDKPEVGDVFESPFAKYVVVANAEVDFCSPCIVCDQKLIKVRELPKLYLKNRCKYIGKSKVKIEDLFKMENE